MTPLVIALALTGQYPSPQYQAPQYAAPMTYSVPVTYAVPQVVTLGAGAVIPPGPFGQFLGHIGRKLEKHSWPRVQPAPIMAQPAMQTIYLQITQPQIQQAVYTVAMPQTYAAPPQTYAAPPQPYKGQPQTYGSPQASQYQAPKPSESVPPVPQH